MKKLLACLVLVSSLCADPKVLAFAGSTRKDSYNKKLLAEAVSVARRMGAEVTVIDLKEFPMPFYDADLEAQDGLPLHAKRLRDLMIEHDCVIIASPQYNGSVSAVLKNSLDWASRSEGGEASRDAFKGKKFAIMSASPKKKGGLNGLSHLRYVIEDCGGSVLEQQVTVGNAPSAFTLDGKLESEKTQEELIQEITVLFR